MITPRVTELPLRLEALTRDPFGDEPPPSIGGAGHRGPAPVRDARSGNAASMS